MKQQLTPDTALETKLHKLSSINGIVDKVGKWVMLLFNLLQQ